VSQLRQRAVFGVLAVVLGALLFVVASAFIVDRGYGSILALAVGVFAFPLAPAVWQLIGERGRTKRTAEEDAKPKKGVAKPKPSTLTGYDRYWLRFVAVTLVVVGPMVGIARFGVVRAVAHHGLWFIPTTPPDLRSIGAGTPRDFKDHAQLLRHVPNEAEVVGVFHDPNAGGNLVWGWSKGHTVLAWDGKILVPGGISLADKLEEYNDQLIKLPWFDKLVSLSPSDNVDVWSSEVWRGKAQPLGDGPTADLRKELSRAPQDAQLVVAYAPRGKDAKVVRGMVGWMTVGTDTVVIEGRAELGDVVTAMQFYTRMNALLVVERSGRSDACKAAIRSFNEHTTIVQNANVITAHAEVSKETVTGLIGCSMSL
jgi:hypothetical protein